MKLIESWDLIVRITIPGLSRDLVVLQQWGGGGWGGPKGVKGTTRELALAIYLSPCHSILTPTQGEIRIVWSFWVGCGFWWIVSKSFNWCLEMASSVTCGIATAPLNWGIYFPSLDQGHFYLLLLSSQPLLARSLPLLVPVLLDVTILPGSLVTRHHTISKLPRRQVLWSSFEFPFLSSPISLSFSLIGPSISLIKVLDSSRSMRPTFQVCNCFII